MMNILVKYIKKLDKQRIFIVYVELVETIVTNSIISITQLPHSNRYEGDVYRSYVRKRWVGGVKRLNNTDGIDFYND